jgi:L-2-hydroxyglutarate oxidase
MVTREPIPGATARCAVVGGGIIGAAVARHLLTRAPGARVTLLEKEPAVAAHQTGHNSGVAHAGLYYPPGSLKATLCRRGIGLLRDFCEQHDLAYDECGKLVIARDESERRQLLDLADRAAANGVPGLRLVDAAEIGEIEPHAKGVAGLHSPTSAVVDFGAVTRALAAEAVAAGAAVRTRVQVTGFAERREEVVVEARGQQFAEAFDLVIVCAGLQADRVAAFAGDDRDPAIVPFRGEYYRLRPERRHLVRGLIYPVPDPRYPFLGVHLTRRIGGDVLVGPNAVLAFAREGYRWRDVSPADLRETLAWPGFRKLARQHWRAGVSQMHGSLSRSAFIALARRYLPDLTPRDVVRGPAGVRAQALGKDGSLIDDFRVSRRGRVVCVRNAPSPAATSSLAIATHLVALALGPDGETEARPLHDL